MTLIGTIESGGRHAAGFSCTHRRRTNKGPLRGMSVELGHEVIWLHCFEERFADPAAAGPPRLPAGEGPTIPNDGAIPADPEQMPDTLDFDAAKRRLIVGEGYIDNVPKAVWDYEISGKRVLVQWFSYRRRDRSCPIIEDRRPPSPLGKVQPDGWLTEPSIGGIEHGIGGEAIDTHGASIHDTARRVNRPI